jgi:hypothetical protein
MKKLLVLTLVLGIASLASASITLVTDYDGSDLNPGDTINFALVSSALGPFQGDTWAVATDAGTVAITPIAIASLTNTVVGDIENNSTILNPAGTVGLWGTTLWSNFAASFPGGEVYTGVLTVAASGTISVYAPIAEDTAFPEASTTVAVKVIPEPATMALLGLGALVLRRKK